jgi:hypothetical protein
MTKRTSWSRPGLAAFALGLAAGPAPATEPTPAPKARIVVAKETTYFLGPLKPDGTVDYAAALNGIQGKGLTPDDNAAVLILPVFGPRILKDRPDAAVATARIGARPLPPTGDYFLPADEYVARIPGTGGARAASVVELRRDVVRRAPWVDADHPLVAGWLRANEKPLARLVEATRRPRFWIPLREGTDLWGTTAELLRVYREAAVALSARAMRKLGSNDPMRAWDDLRAADRLAALVAQGGTEWDGIIGGHMRAVAAEGIHGFATHAALSPEQARSILSDLDRPPAFPSAVDRIDGVQRSESLAWVTAARHWGAQEWKIHDVPPAAPRAADWNAVLRAVNRGFDRFVAAARAPTAAERKRLLQAWEAEVQAADKKAGTSGINEALAVKVGSLSRLGRQLEGIAIGEAFDDLGRIAVALAGYRAEKRAFPATLALLAPSWLKRLPLDPLGPRPFIYARKDGGYVLYSLSLDGKPDKGAGAERGDDIVVRMK